MDVNNKKFLSYMGLGLALIMVLSLAYIFLKPKTYTIENYKLDQKSSYTGPINGSLFQGEGKLETSRGTYQGNFEKGRFAGPGIFHADGFSYKADFDKDKGNKNVKIILDDGKTYIKKSEGFVKEGEKNED